MKKYCITFMLLFAATATTHADNQELGTEKTATEITNQQSGKQFVRAVLSENTIDGDDSATITYRLYFTEDTPINNFLDVKVGKSSDFAVYKLECTNPNGFSEEEYNGTNYFVIDVYKVNLTPTKAGRYEVPTLSLKLTGKKEGSIKTEAEVFTLMSRPATVNVTSAPSVE